MHSVQYRCHAHQQNCAPPSALRPAVAGLSRSERNHRRRATTRAQQEPKDAAKNIDKDKDKALFITLAGGAALTTVVIASATFAPDVEDLFLGDGLSRPLLNPADVASAALWSTSLWFVNPLQLLLLFLGKIETERPSDWLMDAVGAAQGQPVKALGYKHPASVKVLAAVATVVGGSGIAYALTAGLGDSTWAISSGIATCMAAGVYELGRPTRLDAEEAVQLEEQWQVFAGFAAERLQRGGRCHESEIWKAFEAAHPRFRSEENKIKDEYLRDMVANWYPPAKRTAQGFYKNVSLRPKADPFTGEVVGVDLSSTSGSETEVPAPRG